MPGARSLRLCLQARVPVTQEANRDPRTAGGTANPPGPMLAVSVAVVLVLLIGGLFYFRRMEKTFADVV
jgi:ABC-type polysaccharide/polyol phosphate export permease